MSDGDFFWDPWARIIFHEVHLKKVSLKKFKKKLQWPNHRYP